MVSGRFTIRCTLSETFEKFLKLPGPCDNDADLYGPEVKKQAEVIQVTIEKWIFVVPFHLDCDAALEAVNRMSRAVNLMCIDNDGSVKILLDPTFCI